jgi:hypothetical protein
MKKSSSALGISHNSQRLKGSQSYQNLDKTNKSNKSLRKYFKPSQPVNLKEVDWMNYAKVILIV